MSEAESRESAFSEDHIAPKHQVPAFIYNNLDTFRIVFFETIGTLLFTYAFICSKYIPPLQNHIQNPYHELTISLALLIGMFWCRNFSAGHLNPALTIAVVLQKQTLTIKTGITYIVSQFIGAFLGALFAWLFFGVTAGPFPQQVSTGTIITDVFGELWGSFLFVIFFLIASTKETKFIQDDLWFYFFMSMLYYVCRTFPKNISSAFFNPALSLAIQSFQSIQNGSSFAYCLIGILTPFVASLLACVMFQKFYRIVFKSWKQIN